MDLLEIIARKISATEKMTIRDLLDKGFSVDITDESGAWACPYEGKKLTADGVARWSADGTLDIEIELQGGNAIVTGVQTEEQLESVCALFNTLAGNVNEYTYNKYVAE